VELVKKEKTLELLLWGVVAYAAAVLIYYTLKALDHSADFISAFGSILSAIAAFYAAYVAINLFNDWRDPVSFATKKEQTIPVLGVLSQLRFQLNCMLEALIMFKKAEGFVVLNEKYLIYEDQNLMKKVFEIIPNVKYLNNTKIFDDFALIHKHYAHAELLYIQCQKEYKKYYHVLSETEQLKNKEIHIDPYRSYSYYRLDSDNNYAYFLSHKLRQPVGYWVLDSGEMSKDYSFENIFEMVNKTIKLIGEFEQSLINELHSSKKTLI